MNQVDYQSDHWAQDGDPQSALAKAADLGLLPVNMVEWEMFTSLLPASLAGQTVLDYGCGLGGLSLLAAQRGARVRGMDRSATAIHTAQYQARVVGLSEQCEFSVQSAGDCGLEQYDLIIAKDVIEHVEDDERWVNGITAALKPGGTLILSTQNSQSLNYLIEAPYHRWWRGNRGWMGWDPTHVRFYTPQSLRRLLSRHGLTVTKWASMWIIPYNLVSWLTLLKVDLTLPGLGQIDRWLGYTFPFNRLGWCLMSVCQKQSQDK